MRSGHGFSPPCDIRCTVCVHGYGREHREVHVSLVPPWFREDSGTHLIKQGKMSKVVGRVLAR